MKRGEVLKTFLKGIKDSSGLLLEIDNDLNTIPVENAIRIWERLNEDIPVEKKPEPVKAEAKKGGKKPLDDAKMLALRKAGWSYEKIADEMRCATQTVINHIKEKERKK